MRAPTIERAGFTFAQVIARTFCSFCGADDGKHCVNPQGKRLSGFVHEGRWRQFLRVEQRGH